MRLPRSGMSQVWSPAQRGVLVVLLGFLIGYLIIRLALNPSFVPDPQPQAPPRFFDLADKVDPNEADWQTLAALPSIGEKRARDMIAYRERVRAEHPNQRAFSRAEDLLRIRGFGAALVAQLRPHLVFPESNPATTRSAAH